jgi:molybdopterin-guanine dinucleotide biosynthesis protein A
VGGYAAVILAGGAARRLGGVAKPLVPVGGRPMLDRVLAAVADASVTVVVGPAGLAVPPGVLRVSEQPPGGGPVAALAAGLAAVDGETAAEHQEADTLAVLAADLPFLTPKAMSHLRATLDESTVDGALFVDGNGRRQTLCGVWRTAVLRRRLGELPKHHGAALRHLVAGLAVREVTSDEQPPPWYDCDSPDDLDRARRWS